MYRWIVLYKTPCIWASVHQIMFVYKLVLRAASMGAREVRQLGYYYGLFQNCIVLFLNL